MKHLITPPDSSFHLSFFPDASVEGMHIPGAPDYMRGLRILFFSDIHLRRCVSDEKLAALIELIRAQNADLILMGGDYAETPDQCIRFFRAFRGTAAPLGVYGVSGNNDLLPGISAEMKAAGAVHLENRTVSIEIPGGKLEIGGCAEHKYGSPDTKSIFSGEGYRILLSHYPTMPDCRADLMLSGHTHGGQMNFLGLTPYTLQYEHKYRLLAIRGLHEIQGMQLAICNGVGVSRIPLRMGAKPHMLLLDFGSGNG